MQLTDMALRLLRWLMLLLKAEEKADVKWAKTGGMAPAASLVDVGVKRVVDERASTETVAAVKDCKWICTVGWMMK